MNRQKFDLNFDTEKLDWSDKCKGRVEKVYSHIFYKNNVLICNHTNTIFLSDDLISQIHEPQTVAEADLRVGELSAGSDVHMSASANQVRSSTTNQPIRSLVSIQLQ